MSSSWRSVADAWLKGTADVKEVVSEAATEGQLHELLSFFREHPPSIGIRPLTIDSLETFSFGCAYEFITRHDVDRAFSVIRGLKGEPAANAYLKEAAALTLDASTRNALKEYFIQNQIQTDDDATFSKILKVQEWYPTELYSMALERYKAYSTVAFQRPALALFEGFASNFAPGTTKLIDDVRGLIFSMDSQSVWSRVEDVQMGSQTMLSRGVSLRSRVLATSPLFFKTAACLFRDIDDDILNRIVLEGELLTAYFNRTDGVNDWEDSDAKWKAEMQFLLSHHLVDTALQYLNPIPPNCVQQGSLTVSKNHIEVLKHDVKCLCFDAKPLCSKYSRQVMESELLKQGIWLQTEWESPESWLHALATCGVLFDASSAHEDVRNVLKSEEAVSIVIDFCLRYELYAVLQNFLESTDLSEDISMTLKMLKTAQSSDLTQWLILSCLPGQKFASTIANAKLLLSNSDIPIKSLSDLSRADSIYVLLSAIAHSPKPLNQTILLHSSRLAESPGRDDFLVEDGHLCMVHPVCYVADIEPPLQETFPETCLALKTVALQEQQRGSLTFHQFKDWRDQMLRTEHGDAGFLEMVLTSDVEQIKELIRMCQSFRSPVLDLEEKQTAQFWEERHLERVQEWVQTLCHRNIPEGLSIGISQHILCGRPLAAFEFFLAAKKTDDIVKCAEEDIQFLELLSRLLALWNYKDSSVLFSALCFASLCRMDTAKIKVDVCALLRLESIQTQNLDVNHLVEDFATEIAMEYAGRIHSAGGFFAAKKILESLENSMLYSLNLQSLVSSSTSIDCETPVALSESTDVLVRWSFIHTFARIHNLTPSKRLLEKLAQADDWILFLAEAENFRSSITEVIQIAQAQFSDPALGHHICYVLQGQYTPQSSLGTAIENKEPEPIEPFHPRPVSEELFDILLEAERTGNPIQVLLLWAMKLKWRLLTVVASCYSTVAYLDCLVTWLIIGKAKSNQTQSSTSETRQERLVSPRAPVIEQLMSVVCEMCSEADFAELLEGLSLFPVVPLLPMKHFMEAMKFHKLHLFNAAGRHLTAFEDALDKEIKKANSTKASRSTSTSSNVNAMLATFVDLNLIEKITQAAVAAVFRGLDTSFEREKLLAALMKMEIDEGLHWLETIRLLRLTYKFLGPKTNSFITWPSKPFELPTVNANEIFQTLLKSNEWSAAREWACENMLDVQNVTRCQAETLVDEWTEFGFEDDLCDILWDQVDQIFIDHAYPPLKAGLFYVQRAARLPENRMKIMLLEALKWIDGIKVRSLEQVHRLSDQLRRVIYLLDSEGDTLHQIPQKVNIKVLISSILKALQSFTLLTSRYEKCPAMQMVLRPVLEVVSSTGSEISRSEERSGHSSPIIDREIPRPYGRVDAPMTNEEQECLEILEKIVPKATEEQVQKAIKHLLDGGHIEAAESLQKSEKLDAQIEFFLVNIALTIVHKCSSNNWNGESLEKIVLAPILKFLERKGFLDVSQNPLPQDVLDAVSNACKESAGYPVCIRAATTFKVAVLLNMSCVELAQFGPNKVLESLLLKGKSVSQVTKEFVKAYEFTPRATAKKLAEMYMKSLMGSRGISSINEDEPIPNENDIRMTSSSDWLSNSGICTDWVEIGNALMEILVERHPVLTAEIEADILVQSYQCYERDGYVEGLDVLLDLATNRVRDFAAGEKYEAMVKVTVGICRFDGLTEALDVIVQNRKLDLLFQDTNSHNPATISILRSAILSSIYKHSPKDNSTLGVTYRHFNMHVEVGQGIKDKALDLLNQYAAAGRPTRDQRLIKAMDLLIRAGAEFSCAQCSVSASSCGDLVALVAQQICYGERKWVCLSDAECRTLLPQLSDINSALIVARAYKFNTPQDWVLTIWQHMLHIATEFNGKQITSSSLQRALQTLQHYSSSIMKEIVFSNDQLEQVMQMYIAFLEDTEARYVSCEILKHCMARFLSSIADVCLRLTLSKMMKDDDAISLIRECHDILDIDPQRG